MQIGKRSKTQPGMNIRENREGQNAWLYCLLLLFLIDWQTLPYRTSQCFSSEHSQHTIILSWQDQVLYNDYHMELGGMA